MNEWYRFYETTSTELLSDYQSIATVKSRISSSFSLNGSSGQLLTSRKRTLGSQPQKIEKYQITVSCNENIFFNCHKDIINKFHSKYIEEEEWEKFHFAGWQKLEAFQRAQKWSQQFSSGTYICYFHDKCAIFARICNFANSFQYNMQLQKCPSHTRSTVFDQKKHFFFLQSAQIATNLNTATNQHLLGLKIFGRVHIFQQRQYAQLLPLWHFLI